MKHLVRIVCFLALALCWAACASPDEESLSKIAGACVYKGDCSGDLVCVFGLCHRQCDTSEDCKQPSDVSESTRCVAGDPDNVCMLIDETTCKVDADCPLGTLCAVDLQCRAGCQTANDCLDDQVCSYRSCADQNELVDGQLRVLSATSLLHEPCTLSSECTPLLRCLNGQCDYECQANEDCSTGSTCGDDHLCHAAGEAPGSCTPLDCTGAGAACGDTTDGCGHVIHCNGPGPGDHGCPEGLTCGGAGTANQCGPGTCTPATACAANQSCGLRTDGCAGVLDCGVCAGGIKCSADNTCACTPNPNACADGACLAQPDGCGGIVQCNDCDAPLQCVAGRCGGCKPKTCAGDSIECGTLPDGCGGVLDCTSKGCPADLPHCGGDRGPNRCSAVACTPTPSCPTEKGCGFVTDNCGSAVPCGDCTAPESCGGGHTQNVCGCSTQATTCADVGVECGTADNGCGVALECGACATGTCGANGRCSCTPKTCAQLGASCGLLDDGCGGRISCGTCGAGTYCGAQAANQCNVAPPAGKSCGGSATGDCAVSAPFAPLTFNRGPSWYECNQVVAPPAPARVGAFALDARVVTKARFAAYAAGGGYFGANPPESYRGRNPRVSPLVVETGWLPEWNVALAHDLGAFKAAYDANDATAYDTLAASDPVRLTWHEAFAFCLWDGGRLPTDAEWLEAAYDGQKGLAYPWEQTAPSALSCPTVSADSGSDAHGIFSLAGRGAEWTFDPASNDVAVSFDPVDCTAQAGDCVSFAWGPGRRLYKQFPTSGAQPTLSGRGLSDPALRAGVVRCAREVP